MSGLLMLLHAWFSDRSTSPSRCYSLNDNDDDSNFILASLIIPLKQSCQLQNDRSGQTKRHIKSQFSGAANNRTSALKVDDLVACQVAYEIGGASVHACSAPTATQNQLFKYSSVTYMAAEQCVTRCLAETVQLGQL